MAISTITSNSIADGAVTSSDLASGAVEQAMTTQIGGRRNLIINGAMQVAQRGTSSATTNGYATVDRFRTNATATDQLAVTQSQDTNAPDGFNYSYKLAVTTPETATENGELFGAMYKVEGNDVRHLKYGTASAETLTMSFWVKSSITGTFPVSCQNNEATSRIQTQTYTISSANTWEYKTIQFTGDTSVAITQTTSEGLVFAWWLSAGADRQGTAATTWSNFAYAMYANGLSTSADFIETNGATWQITGVQLEVGTVATPFEHRSFGEELALCQRYYQKSFAQGVTPQDGQYTVNVTTAWESSTNARGNWIPFPVEMRATPTFTQYGNSSNWQVFTGSSWQTTTNNNVGASVKSYGFYPTIVGGVTNSSLHPWYAKGDYTVDAEL